MRNGGVDPAALARKGIHVNIPVPWELRKEAEAKYRASCIAEEERELARQAELAKPIKVSRWMELHRPAHLPTTDVARRLYGPGSPIP